MNKLTLLIAAFSVVLTISCKKENAEDEISTAPNEFLYDGTTYSLNNAVVTYNKPEDSVESAQRMSMFFFSDGISPEYNLDTLQDFSGVGSFLAVEVLTSSKTTIPNGTYRGDTTGVFTSGVPFEVRDGTFSVSYNFTTDKGLGLRPKDVRVIVSQKNNVYTFEIYMLLNTNKTITGQYSGKLDTKLSDF
jgi:hypothetical protein